jgi:hypothetical protein
MTFDEYRLLVQPDLASPGQWSIRVQKSPRAGFVGAKPSTTPIVTPPDLAKLRNGTNPPNVAQLRALGKAVLDSIMPPVAQVEFGVCIDDARLAGKGLRVIVSILGTAKVPGGIGCHEIPVEALFDQKLSFLGTDSRTPISRGITVEPDRSPVRVAPPLRILVVVSEPSDIPPIPGQRERQEIQSVLQPLVAAGGVQLDFCVPATPERLDAMLQQQWYHIVHFIGHGDFDKDGPDPTPQPYLYFEEDTPKRGRRAVDAEQMFTMLRNGNVPLIVMTACSSAAVRPNGPEYPGLAFEGLAQTLVERQAGPLAAVAMQFDFETAAAGVFSGTFYRQLLTRDMSVDAAVAAARVALIAKFGAGHRSWINPTVYWRCIDGLLFELLPTAGTLSPHQQAQLIEIDNLSRDVGDMLRELAKQPPEVLAMTASLRADWMAKIDELVQRRGMILGDTLRLRGGKPLADGTVNCELTLQLRTSARVGLVKTSIGIDPAEFTFVGAAAGPAIPVASLVVQAPAAPGQPIVVNVNDASSNKEWAAGEHVLAILTLRAVDVAAQPIFRIPVTAASVTRNDTVENGFGTLDAIVFGG